MEQVIQKKTRSHRRFCNNNKIVAISILTSACSVCCVVFMWISLNKMEQIRRELISLSQSRETNNASISTLKHAVDHKNENDSKQEEDEVLTNLKKMCRLGGCGQKLSRAIALNKDIQESAIRLDTPIIQPSAVHYIPIAVTDGSIRQEFTGNSRCTSKWKGMICRNNTFHSQIANTIIGFWQKAPWTKTHSADVLPLGTNSETPGTFRVQTGGLYLLYLNILISATHSKHDVGIFISDVKKLICRENLDIIRGSTSVSANPKAKTCSVSGVFYIDQNITISVKIVTIDTEIYLDSYNTNFGTVLLV